MKYVKTCCCLEVMGHFEPKFPIGQVIPEETFFGFGKLDGMPFHLVSKCCQSICSFCHNAHV